jgi:hypothetical protein
MVSLKHRQDLATLAEADPRLKRFQLFLMGEHFPDEDSKRGGVHEDLLSALAANDAAKFKEASKSIGQRRISIESDWCCDDYLLFLLLLGHQKFGRPLTFLPTVLEARRQNPNPVPQKINEIFGALERGEFGIDGEFGFFKIPFLHLLGKLRLSPADARKAIQGMSAPALLDQLSPFLRLLAQRAHDLVLIERQPVATETAAQLLEGLETHAKDFSLRHWWRVITALPGRILIAMFAALLGLGLIPVLVGVGKGLVDAQKSQIRVRPSVLAAATIREPSADLPPEILRLVGTLEQSNAPSTKRQIIVQVESQPLIAPTTSFIVEVSHPDKPIEKALAFTETVNEGIRPVTIVPLQHEGGRFRAMVPEQPTGQRLVFILRFEGDRTDTVQSVGKSIVMRPLQ